MSEYPATKKEAVAGGHKYYFTGKPCKRGHVALRSVSRSGCIECLRERDSSPEELARKRRWQKENRHLQRQYNRKYKDWYYKTPEGSRKAHARNILEGAVKYGSIVKPDRCERCGGESDRIEGHHWDYDKPREVEWVCAPCHRAIHNGDLAATPAPDADERELVMAHISAFRCEICGKGPDTGVTVHRVNAKGQPGIWRCEQHMETPVPEDVAVTVAELERQGNGGRNNS